MTFSAGDLVGGRYGLEEVIGSGGMGDVWRARDRVLDRPVALKLVFTGDPRKRAEVSRRFFLEARISAAISHRNVVQILDFGANEADVPFMVMELLDGEPLSHVLGRNDPVSFEWILAVMTQALEGLAAAHDAGVIHRDIKPENIFLVHEREGVYPKLLDFGISKVLESDTGEAILSTRGGYLVGSPAYMSPEQARGLRALDRACDVYSIGVVLYELLSGSMPFYSENPGDLLLMIVNNDAPPLCEIVPDVGKPLSDLVVRAMSKNSADRYPDARAMRAALLEVADGILGSDAAQKLGARVRPPSWRKRISNGPVDVASGEVPPVPGLQKQPIPAASSAKVLHKTPVRAPSYKRWLAVTGVLGLLGVAVAATWLIRSNAASAPRFIVVSADRGAEARSAPALDQTAKPERAPGRRRADKLPFVPRSSAVQAAEVLAESFRVQKAGVVRCVNDHHTELAQTPQLSVHLSLDADGKVRVAEVSPPELGSSAAGACIESAVRAMRFPAQGAPISFQVPLTTKRGS